MKAVTHPGTILGVGPNFLPHTADLRATPTEYPTLFFKGRHTIIGPGDAIPLPPLSTRVTAEAELGLVIGKRMHKVDVEDALGCVAGGCCVLDQTAGDVLQMDSRMLTLSKNFPGFFSYDPDVVPLEPGDIVSTGTPGAVVLSPGDVVECHISGMKTLRNTVAGAAAS